MRLSEWWVMTAMVAFTLFIVAIISGITQGLQKRIETSNERIAYLEYKLDRAEMRADTWMQHASACRTIEAMKEKK